MRVEEFASGDSLVHRLDPRAKIVATMAFSVVVGLTNSLCASLISLVLPVLIIAAGSISLRKIFGRLLVVNAFVLFLWLFLPFNGSGEPLYWLGPLGVYREGIDQALLITVKSNAIFLVMMALLGTSPIFTLVHALSHMGVPDKVVHLFFFCFRYIHVIHEEQHRLIRAMKIRGFQPGTDFHTYRSYAYLVGMLLVQSFDRSRRIVAAMKCRGFQGRFYILHHYHMQTNDYVLAASSLAFTAALLVVW